MNTPSRPTLAIINGHATTTSSQIAEHFGKEHKLVLRAIRNLACSPDFRQRNFAPASIEVEQPNGGTAHRQQTLRDRLDSMWKEDAEASKTPRQLALEAQAEQRVASRKPMAQGGAQ